RYSGVDALRAAARLCRHQNRGAAPRLAAKDRRVGQAMTVTLTHSRQGANYAPAGGSAAAQPQAWGSSYNAPARITLTIETEAGPRSRSRRLRRSFARSSKSAAFI